MMTRKHLATLVLTWLGMVLAPDLARAETVTVMTFGNGAIIGQIMTAVAMLSSGAITALLELTAIGAVIYVCLNIFMGEGTPRSHFSHLIIFVILYYGMFLPRVNVQILDSTNQLGGPAPYTNVINNVPAGLGYMASFTSRIGYALTVNLEQAFSLPGYLNYRNFGLGMTAQIVSSNPPTPVREMGNLQSYINSCIMPALNVGSLNPDKIATSTALETALAPPSNMAAESARYVDANGTPSSMFCPTAYAANITDLQAWAVNNGGKQMAAINGFLSRDAFFGALGPAYFGMLGMNTTPDAVIKQRTLMAAFRQAVTTGGPGADANLMNVFAVEASKYATEQSTLQVTAQLTKQYLPIFRSVYQALLFGLFPVVIAMAFLPMPGSKLIGLYIRQAIWIELWDPVFAIHNLISFMYQQQSLKNMFATGGWTDGSGNASGLSLINTAALDSTAGFQYAIVMLTAPIAVSFAYFLVSAAENIGEGLVNSVGSKLTGAAGSAGADALLSRGVYNDAMGSLNDRHMQAGAGYTRDQSGLLHAPKDAHGMPTGGSSYRAPMSFSSKGTMEGATDAGHMVRQSDFGGGLQTIEGAIAGQGGVTKIDGGSVSIAPNQSVSQLKHSQAASAVSRTASEGEQTSSSTGIQHGTRAGDATSESFSGGSGRTLQESKSAGFSTDQHVGTDRNMNTNEGFSRSASVLSSIFTQATDGVGIKAGLRGADLMPKSAPRSPGAPPSGASQNGSPTQALQGAQSSIQGAGGAPDPSANADDGQLPGWVAPAIQGAAIAAGVFALPSGPGAVAASMATRTALAAAAARMAPTIAKMARGAGGSKAAQNAAAKSMLGSIIGNAAANLGIQTDGRISNGSSNAQDLSTQQVASLARSFSANDGFRAGYSEAASVSQSDAQRSSHDMSTSRSAGTDHASTDSNTWAKSTQTGTAGSESRAFTERNTAGSGVTIGQQGLLTIGAELTQSYQQQGMNQVDAFGKALNDVSQLQQQLIADPGQAGTALTRLGEHSPTAATLAQQITGGERNATQFQGDQPIQKTVASIQSPLSPSNPDDKTSPSRAEHAVNTSRDNIDHHKELIGGQAAHRMMDHKKGATEGISNTAFEHKKEGLDGEGKLQSMRNQTQSLSREEADRVETGGRAMQDKHAEGMNQDKNLVSRFADWSGMTPGRDAPAHVAGPNTQSMAPVAPTINTDAVRGNDGETPSRDGSSRGSSAPQAGSSMSGSPSSMERNSGRTPGLSSTQPTSAPMEATETTADGSTAPSPLRRATATEQDVNDRRGGMSIDLSDGKSAPQHGAVSGTRYELSSPEGYATRIAKQGG